MRDLTALKQPECRDVVMGLLLTVQTLSQMVNGQTAHLLCEIYADAQSAWVKSHASQQESQDE